MRFCLVSTQQNWGGGEILISSIARQLVRAGHTLSWIVRGGSEVERYIDAMQPSTILHRTSRRGLNPRDLRSVRRGLHAWSPDVILMNDTHAVALAGTTTWFCGVSRPVRLAYKHTIFPLRSKLKYQLLTDKVICVSHAAQRAVTEGGMRPEDVAVVYGGVDVPIPSSTARQEIRTELGIHPQQRLLVSVGNLHTCKGHHDAILALSQMPEACRGLLAIAGEGPERPNLERQIADLGLKDRVRLLGFRQDANRLLQAADIVVHPSHSEGLSLVLIQAQMLAKPIVATAVGGAAEVLGTVLDSSWKGSTKWDEGYDPRNGSTWISRPADPSHLAQQILAALSAVRSDSDSESLEQSLQLMAARARELFSIENNCRELVELAEGLLQARVSTNAA